MMKVLVILPNANLPVMSVCCNDDFQVTVDSRCNGLSLYFNSSIMNVTVTLFVC
jgi:hypothetical protein